jgi:LysM repeat protein
MKNHRILVFFVVVLIALTLAACERSASTQPPEGTIYPTLEGTSPPMNELETFATQTAAAMNPDSGEEGTEGGDTSPEEQPTEAPPPEPTEEPQQPEATPVPPTEYPVPDEYSLRKGEFPYCIARRFDISPGALLAANGLNNASVTYAGQTLKIPKDAGPFDAGPRELKSHPDDYTVQAGDTVYSIACQYGSVDPRAIEDHNGLSGAYTLQVGDVLVIP